MWARTFSRTVSATSDRSGWSVRYSSGKPGSPSGTLAPDYTITVGGAHFAGAPLLRDLNDDGLLDMVVGEEFTSPHHYFFGNGQGWFSYQGTLPTTVIGSGILGFLALLTMPLREMAVPPGLAQRVSFAIYLGWIELLAVGLWRRTRRDSEGRA